MREGRAARARKADSFVEWSVVPTAVVDLFFFLSFASPPLLQRRSRDIPIFSLSFFQCPKEECRDAISLSTLSKCESRDEGAWKTENKVATFCNADP